MLPPGDDRGRWRKRPLRVRALAALPRPSGTAPGRQLATDHDDFNRRLPALRRIFDGKGKPDPRTPDVFFLEHSLLWNRRYDYKSGYGGAVLVHGHTPTVRYDECYYESDEQPAGTWDQFAGFPRKALAPFLFSRSPGAVLKRLGGDWWDPWARNGRFEYATNGDLGVEAINVDTGAVAAGALTALGLSPGLLSEGLLATLACPTTVKCDRVRKVLKLEAKRELMDELDGYQLPKRFPCPAPS